MENKESRAGLVDAALEMIENGGLPDKISNLPTVAKRAIARMMVDSFMLKEIAGHEVAIKIMESFSETMKKDASNKVRKVLGGLNDVG